MIPDQFIADLERLIDLGQAEESRRHTRFRVNCAQSTECAAEMERIRSIDVPVLLVVGEN